MANKNFKQFYFSKDDKNNLQKLQQWTDGTLLSEFQQKNITEFAITAPFGTWFYVNNDIYPIIIDETNVFNYKSEFGINITSLSFLQDQLELLEEQNIGQIILTIFYMDVFN